MFVCNLCILLFVCDTALSFIQLPCLTNESRDFSYAKQVLKELNTYMNSQIQQSRNILHNLKANAAQKIKKAENALTNGIDKKRWKKYNGHCYYYTKSNRRITWFKAESYCRKIGGYLVKLDNTPENKWVYANRPYNGDYWIGLTDLYEGHFRWTFDQSKTTFTKWVNGYGSKGTSSNCVSYNTAGKAEWFDNSCYNTRPFVCETNYCVS
ncbi:asialoglycoprotein receptor 2 [Mytilus galloprovincialis]|uniref:Asialoglycoprotein receptor 2 n=1 Tax=Mytilus galloprovincialis TaxID=29158 RepID=A0A8B6DJV5_MYTGA|nr:asialoglycoprotein receptor 2 [Mytilus galloprovincialis]